MLSGPASGRSGCAPVLADLAGRSGYIWQVLLPSVPQTGPPLLQRSMTLTLDLGFCVRAPRPLGVYVKTDTGEASDATARTNLLNSDSAFDIAPILQVNE